jgi:hypothetical protein
LNPIPALDHEKPEDFRKVSSVVTTEKSGNILEEEPSGSKLVQDSRKLVNERAALAAQSLSLPRDRPILAWDAGTDEINPRQVRISSARCAFGNRVFRTFRQNSSFSTCQTECIPGLAQAFIESADPRE